MYRLETCEYQLQFMQNENFFTSSEKRLCFHQIKNPSLPIRNIQKIEILIRPDFNNIYLNLNMIGVSTNI